MKQMTDFSAPGGSASVTGIVSELVVGAITGVSAVRKLFFRVILLVAIAVAAISFTIGMMFRDYLYSKPAPPPQNPTPASGSAGSQKAKPSPKERNDKEELHQLIQKNPL
jgi:hypothetical protein